MITIFLVIPLIRDKWVTEQKEKNKREKPLRNSINNIYSSGKKKVFYQEYKEEKLI